MTTDKPQGLTAEEAECFMKNGYVKLEGVFSPEAAAQKTKDVWNRLDMDPKDVKTWTKEWINMPGISSGSRRAQANIITAFNRWDVVDFAPRAWAAIGELVVCDSRCRFSANNSPTYLQGGHERLSTTSTWNDAWIVNLGRSEYNCDLADAPGPKAFVGYNHQLLRNDNIGWHCDGDVSRPVGTLSCRPARAYLLLSGSYISLIAESKLWYVPIQLV
jgi:hypothetical protein